MLEIVYEDELIVGINKPHNLLVHKTNLDKQADTNALIELRDQIGTYVYPAHRLDKATSGVLLFAKEKECSKKLFEIFREREVEKKYLAVVRGYVASQHIDYPLKKIVDKYGVNRYKSQESQEAITDLKTLDKIELQRSIDKYSTTRYSLVELSPKTGRKHQLRRHLKHISHPIIGDKKYGKSQHNNFFKDEYQINRLLLHANSLKFFHPFTKKEISIKAGVDENFLKIFQEFSWSV